MYLKIFCVNIHSTSQKLSKTCEKWIFLDFQYYDDSNLAMLIFLCIEILHKFWWHLWLLKMRLNVIIGLFKLEIWSLIQNSYYLKAIKLLSFGVHSSTQAFILRLGSSSHSSEFQIVSVVCVSECFLTVRWLFSLFSKFVSQRQSQCVFVYRRMLTR